jgi:hypothetical protein
MPIGIRHQVYTHVHLFASVQLSNFQFQVLGLVAI